jgi:DNA-binding IclR family transcriptional regulator
VDNALRLLSLFRTHERIRVKDAAEALQVATGTAHRVLAMLVYRGYVTQDPFSKVYIPGVMLLSIGLQAVQRSDLRNAARPFLEDLRDQLDETIQLATLEGVEVLFIDGVESTKTLRVTSRAGTLRPAHCTSVGKALLTQIPRESLLDLYPEENLTKVTQNSIGTRSQLLLELDAIRTRGYALNFGELEDGIGSVACEVSCGGGRVLGAIGAGAPMSRLDDLRIVEMADHIRKAADELGKQINQ